MKIEEIIKRDDKTLAICVGENLHPGIKCSKIKNGGRTIPVLDCYVKETFLSGIMAAYITLPKDAEVHKGKVEIIA